MSADEPLPSPTLEELERALDEAVSMLVEYRHQLPKAVGRALAKQSGVFNTVNVQQLIGTDTAVLAARDLVKAPVEDGIKASIRKLGKLIHEQVGDAKMIEVAERVCGLDDRNWGRRMSPIDSAWNGIGSWYS